jgi:hypothetical protein
MTEKFRPVWVKLGSTLSSQAFWNDMNRTLKKPSKRKPKEIHMGIDKLIALGAALAILAASTGQLPRAIRAVHIAQLHLIKQSQASKWPKAQLLPDNASQPESHR